MRRRRGRTVWAALAGAALALPVGMWLGRSPPEPAARVRGGSASVRNAYSPGLLSDAYFIDQQRRVVEALEAGCRASGAHCAEARAARRRLTGLEQGR